MQLTYNNHLKFYINQELYGQRNNSFDRYSVDVGKIDIEHFKRNNFRTELLRVAWLVNDNLKSDFDLYLSAGTDSLLVLDNLLKIGIKPNIVIIKFFDNSNYIDVSNAIKAANDRNCNFTIIEFDTKKFFLTKECAYIAEKYYCVHPFLCALFKIVKQRNRPAVMGGNAPLTKKTTDNYWYYTFMESEESSTIRFSLSNNIPVIYEFFSYTPELMLYWLDCYGVHQLVETSKYKLKAESSKNKILQTLLPEITLQTKLHGWETTLPFAQEIIDSLWALIPLRLTDCLDGIEYNDVLKRLWGTDDITN